MSDRESLFTSLADTVRDHFYGDFDNEPQGVAAHAALDALVAEIARQREQFIVFFGQVSEAERFDTNAGDSAVSCVLAGWQQTVVTAYANERISG